VPIVGSKCERLLTELIQDVPVSDVQCDELWGFVFKNEGLKWLDEANRQDIGDAYFFVGMESYT
jgi:hypothetical protein